MFFLVLFLRINQFRPMGSTGYLKKLTMDWKSPGISTRREMTVVKISAGEGVSLWTWAMARISGYETKEEPKHKHIFTAI